LVTGGAGFIGSHIADRLLQEQFEVTVLDDLSIGKIENVKAHIGKSNFHFIDGDIRTLEVVKRAVENVEVIFHEAAFVGVTESINKPLITNEINVNGTINLLEASRQEKVECLILASSAAVYGEPRKMPIKEETATFPNSPYAVSKLAAEFYARAYCQTYGLRTSCLRYFNVYGPRQAYGPYAGVITAFVNDLTENRPPTIHGDGKQTRDFVNIMDVVQANMLAMEKNRNEVFNVATGSSVTINDLLKTIKKVLGKNGVEPIYVATRTKDICRSCGDISKISEILGFKPEIPLERGLKDLIEYHRKTAHCS
jgi:UDP-glucose 4-epimerase